MKQSTRELLERAADFRKGNPGHGYSVAWLIRKALENEDWAEGPIFIGDLSNLR